MQVVVLGGDICTPHLERVSFTFFSLTRTFSINVKFEKSSIIELVLLRVRLTFKKLDGKMLLELSLYTILVYQN